MQEKGFLDAMTGCQLCGCPYNSSSGKVRVLCILLRRLEGKRREKAASLGNIYERLELVVRERIEHDKCLSHGDGLPTPKMSPLVPKGHHQAHATRAESVRLPPQSLRDTNTSTPSISPPVRVPWYKVEEEAKSSRKKEGPTP